MKNADIFAVLAKMVGHFVYLSYQKIIKENQNANLQILALMPFQVLIVVVLFLSTVPSRCIANVNYIRSGLVTLIGAFSFAGSQSFFLFALLSSYFYRGTITTNIVIT